MDRRIEFASEEWFAELRKLLDKYVAMAPPDTRVSLCEVFTGLPAHLDRDGTGRIAWHCHVADGKVTFGFGEADTDAKTFIDYQFVLPLARMRIGPDTAEEYQRLKAEGVASGKMTSTGDYSKVPQSFMGMHNELAEITA